jgi:hypothetical protein
MKVEFKTWQFITILSLFSLNGCQKNDNQVFYPTYAKEEKSVLRNESYKESEDYLVFSNDVIEEDYEVYGKIAYEHMKSKAGIINPLSYVSEIWKNDLEKSLKKINEEEQGKDYSTIINECIESQYISSKEGAVFLEFSKEFKNKLEDGTIYSFASLWNTLRKLESGLKENLELNADEKSFVLATSSIIRNMAKYEYEGSVLSEQLSGLIGSDDRAGDCLWGIKKSCWADAILKAVAEGFKAGVTSTLLNNNNQFFDTDFWNAFKVWGIFGAIVNVLTNTLNPLCKCDPLPGATCGKPIGIDIIVEDCDIEIVAVARIVGINPNSTTWTITNGRAVDFSVNNPAFLQVVGTTMRISPIDPSLPTTIAVGNNCPGTTTLGSSTFAYNIRNIVRDPGLVVITGPSTTSVGQVNNYSFNGTALTSINANNTLLSGCSFHGTVVSSGPSFIDVKWTTSTGGGAYGGGSAYINSTSRNACSLSISNASKQVTVNP